jgi:hypothetical protein
MDALESINLDQEDLVTTISVNSPYSVYLSAIRSENFLTNHNDVCFPPQTDVQK